MKIPDRKQVREADALTIKNESITAADLMERAAERCVEWIIKNHSLFAKQNSLFHVFCGLGNNGGDGLAIARLLCLRNYSVFVYIVRYSGKSSDEFKINESKIKDSVNLSRVDIFTRDDICKIKLQPGGVIIDALFGSGIHESVQGFPAEVIEYINYSSLPVISIDMPSGLSPDPRDKIGGSCVRAAYTLSFQVPKMVFFFQEFYPYTGEFVLIDIGLDSGYLSNVDTINYYTTLADIKSLIKPRKKFSHKGTYGHALLISGSLGKTGAAVLASGSCLRSGSGLLTVHTPKCGYLVMQANLPEAMVSVDENEEYITGLPSLEKYAAIGIGPGISDESQTSNVLKLLIQNAVVPLVLDADALNILAANKTWLSFIPRNSVLTPHPKEFERLAGKNESGYERYCSLRDFAFKYSVYVVLKGANTAIGCPDGCVYFNSTGNPGMAKGGSGDVLTGIITGLLAQGFSPKEAAVLGTFWHGLAGDMAAEKHSLQSMTAADITDNMGEAFKRLIDGR